MYFNNDNPFCNIEAFIFKPLSKRRVPVLSIIAAQRDNITWWNFPSWCRGGATQGCDHELIMHPKMCLTWYSFLIEGGKWKYTQKRISSFRQLNWLQNIIFYDKGIQNTTFFLNKNVVKISVWTFIQFSKSAYLFIKTQAFAASWPQRHYIIVIPFQWHTFKLMIHDNKKLFFRWQVSY